MHMLCPISGTPSSAFQSTEMLAMLFAGVGEVLVTCG